MYKTYMSVVASLLMVVSVTANAGPGKRPGDTSIYEIAKSTTIHTTLVALLDRVGLGEAVGRRCAKRTVQDIPHREQLNSSQCEAECDRKREYASRGGGGTFGRPASDVVRATQEAWAQQKARVQALCQQRHPGHLRM